MHSEEGEDGEFVEVLSQRQLEEEGEQSRVSLMEEMTVDTAETDLKIRQ